MGSLHAAEQTRSFTFWKKWIGVVPPSADTVGRVAALMEPDGLRKALQSTYGNLKRNKALPPQFRGMSAAVLDGHESHASYNQCCFGCLVREVTTKTKTGEEVKKIQYYHRNVTLSLIGANFDFMLDAEPIFSGEDEVAAAIRLLERVLRDYPRAFDIVLADGLYTDPRFFRFLVGKSKHVLTVLKDDRRLLIKDAVQMFETITPITYATGKTEHTVWDMEGFSSWPQAGVDVRVVRSLEKTPVKHQLTKQMKIEVSNWLWVTTLSQSQIDTKSFVELAHRRWNIENRGFNELVTRWKADHVYRHDPVAILNFWLATLLAHNVFMAFFHCNLKAAMRARHTMIHVAQMILAEIYAGLRISLPKRPP